MKLKLVQEDENESTINFSKLMKEALNKNI